jgi:hypothetical protein
MELVIKRWLSFCKDQHKLIFQAWRNQVKLLSPKERTLMQQKLIMQSIQRYISLRDQGRLILDAARLGNRIKAIIPCLDPRPHD